MQALSRWVAAPGAPEPRERACTQAINTSECFISATDKRIQSLTEVLSFLLGSERACEPDKGDASVCGKIIPFENCVGNVTGLMTRNTFAVVNSATN